MTTKTSAANRLGLDYRFEARRLGAPPCPIIDVHTHINGTEAAKVYRDVADLFGIGRIYSMSRFQNIGTLREILGDRIRFITVPDYMAEDKRHAFTKGWFERIGQFAEAGSRLCKFWAAPRALDYERELDLPGTFAIDSEHRRTAMNLARDAGMMFMAHIADPDTWFATKYADSSRYGTKLDQYVGFEKMLDEFGDVPWIAAHMGGYPEDLGFLDALLSRHDNLNLDTSATKWIVREVSKHSRDEVLDFLKRWTGRILFGSDIVTLDDHLKAGSNPAAAAELAAGREEAFDLYASRYFALRTLWEGDYDGESPIADPDLKMVDPEAHDELSAPRLSGKALPSGMLQTLYSEAATNLVESWWMQHGGR